MVKEETHFQKITKSLLGFIASFVFTLIIARSEEELTVVGLYLITISHFCQWDKDDHIQDHQVTWFICDKILKVLGQYVFDIDEILKLQYKLFSIVKVQVPFCHTKTSHILKLSGFIYILGFESEITIHPNQAQEDHIDHQTQIFVQFQKNHQASQALTFNKLLILLNKRQNIKIFAKYFFIKK